jgi:hypothetical protein
MLMYIVRWLLGNPIVATWAALALGVVATLLFFGSGNGNNEQELSSDTSIVSSSETVKASADTIEDTTNVAIQDNNNETPASIKVENEVTTDAISGKVAKVIETTANEEAQKVTNVTDVKVATKEKIEKTETKEKPPLKSELDKATTSTASTETKGSATTDLSQVTNEEMLLMAREAYWNNGLDEAAEIYKKLIEKEPKVLEHKGELGNVYWRQGYPKKAAELYSNIAIPMIENGRADRVANMIGFIGLFYPDRAAEINKRMQSNK